MNLEEKLGKINDKILLEKKNKEEAEKLEILKPVRENINRLKKEKKDLEIINNSLNFKKESVEDGLGMKDYASETSSKKEEKYSQLKETVDKNPAAMESLGIKNVEELASYPEFEGDREVVDYKQSIKQEEELHLSDSQLQKRLESLGIKTNEKDFSYEVASQEISKRLESLDNELLAEKLKTPEGKEEIIDKLADGFFKNTNDIVYEDSSIRNNDQKLGRMDSKEAERRYDFSFEKPGQYAANFGIELLADKTLISGYNNLRVLPENFKKEIDSYGIDIAKEALIKAYSKKTEEAFNKPDDLLGREKRLRAAIELANPEKKRQAFVSMREFESKKRELLNLLDSKSEELKGQGVEFNVNYSPTQSSQQIKEISQDLESRNNNIFPRYNVEAISAIAKRHVGKIDEALNLVKDINDEESSKAFLKNAEIRDYLRSSGNKFANKYEDYFGENIPEDISSNEYKDLSTKFNSYEEAAAYHDKEISELESVKEKLINKLAEVVDYKVTEFELKSQHGQNTDLRSMEYEDRRNKNEREDAKNILLEIAKLEAKLPQNEDLKVSGSRIEILSKIDEYTKVSQERKEKEEYLSEKKLELRRQKNSEPWLGKGKWRDKISEIEKEIVDSEEEIVSLKSKYDKLVKEAYHYIDPEKLSFTESKNALKDYYGKGKSEEAFHGLKEQLNKLAKKDLPAGQGQFFDKLKNLSNKLEGKG